VGYQRDTEAKDLRLSATGRGIIAGQPEVVATVIGLPAVAGLDNGGLAVDTWLRAGLDGEAGAGVRGIRHIRAFPPTDRPLLWCTGACNGVLNFATAAGLLSRYDDAECTVPPAE